MDDKTADLHQIEELKKAFALIDECLVLNKISTPTSLNALINLIARHHYEKGDSFKEFQDAMRDALEYFRPTWEKKK